MRNFDALSSQLPHLSFLVLFTPALLRYKYQIKNYICKVYNVVLSIPVQWLQPSSKLTYTSP